MGFELDQYAYLKSAIHQWEPKCKLIGLLALILAFSFITDLRLVPAMLGITALLYILSRLPLRFWLHRLSYPGLFILTIVLILPFTSGDTLLWQWGVLRLRQEGLAATVLIVSRFVSIVTLGLILLGTMPFLTTINAMRSLGLSPLLADLLLLSYRYLFETGENLSQMQRAMVLRGFFHKRHKRLPFLPDWQTLSDLAAVTGTLLIRSYAQSERIYKAMQLRGYGTKKHLPKLQLSEKTQNLGWSRIGLAIALFTAMSLILVDVML